MAKMPLVYNDPRHWHQRATEARQLADRMTDPIARARMIEIAEQYAKIAERAVERLKAHARGVSPIIPSN